MAESSYKTAGVDIDAKYAAVQAARESIRSTFTPGVMSDIGLFGGLFDLDAGGAAGQVLVASTDGVGTKVRIAADLRRYDSVGHCIVNHSVNDVLVQGARPLFFLDYIGTGRLEPGIVSRILEGIAAACRESGCALLGGETAEMPGMYADGEFEIVGTIIGAVPRERLLDGSRVRSGDVLVALPSNGLHTNGYSLARHVVEQSRYGYGDTPEGLTEPLGDALLAVHRCYLGPVMPLLEADDSVHACAHVTGGGIVDNLPRVLPAGLGAEVERASVAVPAILDWVVREGRIDRDVAYRVFNMGFGFILVVACDRAPALLERLRAGGEDAREVGRIVEGVDGVQLR